MANAGAVRRVSRVVLRSSCDIKMRLFRRYCVKNPRNTSVLLWFFPCLGEKSAIFISRNRRATLHSRLARRPYDLWGSGNHTGIAGRCGKFG
jgi:hypothetical protein